MTNLIQIRKSITDADINDNNLAKLDTTVQFNPSITFPNNATMLMQVTGITISDRIPNIFNALPYYDFDNTRMRVIFGMRSDGADAIQVDITLDRGLYMNVDSITAAITEAIYANNAAILWGLAHGGDVYRDKTDPGLAIMANEIVDKVIIKIDSAKLNPAVGLFRFQFGRANCVSDMAYTLGFSEDRSQVEWTNAPPLVASVTSYSNRLVKMDTQGTACDIQCSLAPPRKRNNDTAETLAIVHFAGKMSRSDNIWPSGGQMTPPIIYTGPSSIRDVKINVYTMEGRPMLFMGGSMLIDIMFTQQI